MRFVASFILALGVSVGLFWGMNTLITSNVKEKLETKPTKAMSFVRLKQEERIERKKRQKPKRKKVEKPKPVKMKTKMAKVDNTKTPQTAPPKLAMPEFNMNLELPSFSGLKGAKVAMPQVAPNENVVLTPLVRINPRYPRRARRMGREGFVELRFKVLADGTVGDIHVIRSKPRKIFDEAAKSALAKWKFKPKKIEGKALEEYASLTFDFKLEK